MTRNSKGPDFEQALAELEGLVERLERGDLPLDEALKIFERGVAFYEARGTVNARFWDPANSLPCQTPPWAHLMAINANTGDIAWKVPLGTSDELEAKGIMNTGAFGQGGPIATAGGLVFIAGTIDKRFRAFDSRTGQVLWEARLESEGHTTPMTYMAPNGKQYVVVVTTGVNAFALE